MNKLYLWAAFWFGVSLTVQGWQAAVVLGAHMVGMAVIANFLHRRMYGRLVRQQIILDELALQDLPEPTNTIERLRNFGFVEGWNQHREALIAKVQEIHAECNRLQK